MLPKLKIISKKEFEEANGIFKIIAEDGANIFFYFEMQEFKYFVGYYRFGEFEVSLSYFEKENYLLIGTNFSVVVLNISNGRILMSLGLFSFFQGFENTNNLYFTIFSEREDIVINKNGFSISQIIPHSIDESD